MPWAGLWKVPAGACWRARRVASRARNASWWLESSERMSSRDIGRLPAGYRSGRDGPFYGRTTDFGLQTSDRSGRVVERHELHSNRLTGIRAIGVRRERKHHGVGAGPGAALDIAAKVLAVRNQVDLVELRRMRLKG